MLVLDRVAPLERIKLTSELAAKSSAVPAAKGIEKVNLARDIASLIALLTGGRAAAPAAPSVEFSLNDKEGSAKSLARYLDDGMASMSDAVAAFEAETVAELARLTGDSMLSHRALNHIISERGSLAMQSHSAAAKIAAYEEFASRGVKVDIDRERHLANVEKLDEEWKSGYHEDPDFIAARAEHERYYSEVQQQLKDIFRRANDRDNGLSDEERDALVAEFKRIRDVESPAKLSALMDARSAAIDKWVARFKERRDNAIAAPGRAVINSILEASPISEQQAKEWAARQVIDAATKAKLKRIGYAPEQVIADMAEFYRLTGGKSSAIRLSSDRTRRAHAIGVTTAVGEKIIMVDGDFNKTTLFHELAHYLENDPIARAASNGFLLKRRESDTVYRLRDLTGNKGYDAREVAYKDKWINHYIGKVYNDGVTECFSMAVQYLANPADAAMLAAKDPEMLAYVSGYLTSPLTPAMKAKLALHETAISSLQDKKATEEELYAQAIEKLAGTVTLANDGWFKPGEITFADRAIKSLSADGSMPEYIGSDGDYRVFQGVFKNKATGRKSKAHVVVKLADSFKTQGDWNYSGWAPIVGGIEQAKAFIAACKIDHEQMGNSVSQTYYGYFYEAKGVRSPKPKIIKIAGLAADGVPA